LRIKRRRAFLYTANGSLPDYTKVIPIAVTYYDTSTKHVIGIRKVSSDFSSVIDTKYFAMNPMTNGSFNYLVLSYNSGSFNLACTTDTSAASNFYTCIANISSDLLTINGCIKISNYGDTGYGSWAIPNIFTNDKYTWLRSTAISAGNTNVRESFFTWSKITDFSTSTKYYNSQTSITRGDYITSIVPATLFGATSTTAEADSIIVNLDMSSMTLVSTLPTVSNGGFTMYSFGNIT